MYSVYAYDYVSGGTSESNKDEDGNKVYSVTPIVWNKFLLYSPAAATAGYAIFNAKVTKETNKAGSFTFAIAPTHPVLADAGTYLAILKTTIVVLRDDTEIWRGRIIDETTDFYGNIKITCEGELTFLNDIVIHASDEKYSARTSVRKWLSQVLDGRDDGGLNWEETIDDRYAPYSETYPYTWTGARYGYTKICSEYRKIVLGIVNNSSTYYVNYNENNGEDSGDDGADTDRNTSSGSSNEYLSVLNMIQNAVIDVFGGFIEITRDPDTDIGVLNYYSYDNAPDTNAEIVFGRNMIDFSQYIDATSIYTGIFGIADTTEEGTITTGWKDGGHGTWYYFQIYAARKTGIDKKDERFDYFNGSDDEYGTIYKKSAVDAFGKIVRVVNFQNLSDHHELATCVYELLQNSVKESVTITINAVDLSLLGVDCDAIDINRKVYVTSLPHGLDREEFFCSKVELDILNPANTTYTIGAVPETLTMKQVKLNNKVSSVSQ